MTIQKEMTIQKDMTIHEQMTIQKQMTIHKQMTRHKQAGCASTRRFARDSAQAHVQPGTVLEPSKMCQTGFVFSKNVFALSKNISTKRKILSKVASDCSK